MPITFRNIIISCLLVMISITGCSSTIDYPDIDRLDKIPADIAKRDPLTDPHPPILHSSEFEEPIPLPHPINTAGAEDSPFILSDGKTLYFFFTPDVRVPPEKQLLDDVTGIYVSYKRDDSWSTPKRVWLQEPGKLSLDGAVCIQGDHMWFASAREGYTGVNMFTAELKDGHWVNWQYVGDQLMLDFELGEVHLHGSDLYFHSSRLGKGEYNIWVTSRINDGWSEPINIEAVNTDANESLPFVSSDGQELWFTRTYFGTPAIFRSQYENDRWSEPELIISQFAGEPTLDDDGNLYFVHHFFEDDVMIEADIYVAYRKK